MKKHKIEETVRFSTYSYTKDFRVTGKKRFDFVIYDKGCAPNFTFLYSQQILQKLATETYKVRKGFLPTLITELFEPRNEHPYNLRYVSQLKHHYWILCTMALTASLFSGPKCWKLFPNKLKNIQVWKLSKIELKIRSLETILVEFVRFTSAMLKKKCLDHLFSRCSDFIYFLDTVLRFI